jgi:hypothetical protein
MSKAVTVITKPHALSIILIYRMDGGKASIRQGKGREDNGTMGPWTMDNGLLREIPHTVGARLCCACILGSQYHGAFSTANRQCRAYSTGRKRLSPRFPCLAPCLALRLIFVRRAVLDKVRDEVFADSQIACPQASANGGAETCGAEVARVVSPRPCLKWSRVVPPRLFCIFRRNLFKWQKSPVPRLLPGL